MDKNIMEQLELFEKKSIGGIEIISDNKSEWGTFKDSLKAPIHNWFTYPAGFSYKAVEHTIKESGLKIGKDTIYDPFMGSGTTNLVARSMGINSMGVEAHPFVFPITQSKFYWEIDFNEVKIILDMIENKINNTARPANLIEHLNQVFPELILKCFLPDTLFDLLVIRNTINETDCREELKNFFRTGLICVLRDVSIAATGWPYIAPNKIKITSKSKNAYDTFKKRIIKMVGDIVSVKSKAYKGTTSHQLILGDSRDTREFFADESANHIFTSPPYLNNFDYADRTRLEMYFMANVIPRKLMGVEPLEPGFRKIRIKPQPSSLEYAEIKCPTIRGDVLMSFKNKPEQSFSMNLTIPANTMADVYLPFWSKTQKVSMDGSPVKYRKEGDFVVVKGVGSGNHFFELAR